VQSGECSGARSYSNASVCLLVLDLLLTSKGLEAGAPRTCTRREERAPHFSRKTGGYL